MSPLRSLAESQDAGVSWSAPGTLLLSTGWMIPWVLKLPSWAASSTTTSGRLWAVAAAVSLVSKSVRVKKGSILIPVFLVNASKIAWYALGESFAPRAQTRNGPEASALAGPGPLPDEQPTRVGAARAAASSAAATRADAAVRAIIPPFMFVNENQIDEPRPRQPTSAPDEWSSALVGYGAVTGGNSVVTGAERALA